MSDLTAYETHGALGPAAATILRVVRGARHRFALRVPDWFSGSVILSFGLCLVHWPEMFVTFHAFYALLDEIGSAQTWGVVCVTIGVLRLIALTVNGTFPKFRWSPHIRFVMAMASAFVWFQITLALIVSHMATTGLAVYPHLFLFDLYNVFLAASEAGMVERAARHERE